MTFCDTRNPSGEIEILAKNKNIFSHFAGRKKFFFYLLKNTRKCQKKENFFSHPKKCEKMFLRKKKRK
jgi:hypothetical protein